METVFADRFVVVVPLFVGWFLTEETRVVVFFHNILIQGVYIKVAVRGLMLWVNSSAKGWPHHRGAVPLLNCLTVEYCLLYDVGVSCFNKVH